ncbi:MAG TPA: hypothetical protein VFN28_06550 [Amaricoccus sp.]|nr:hypothetical protein [Amaricoccus sp.]
MNRLALTAAAAALLGGVAAAGIAAAQDAPPTPPADAPAAAPGGPAAAGPAGRGGPMAMMGFGPGRIDFVSIDTDGNGSLSRAELVARATERLSLSDSDGNGTLTRAELVAAMPAPRFLDLFGPNPGEAFADRVLALAGATEAGEISVADLAGQRVNFLLAFADTDRDAAISQAEADAMGKHGGRRGHFHRGMERGGDRGGQGDHGDGHGRD